MRCDAQTLTQHAIALLQAVGMPEDKAHVVAHVLVEGDLLGHWTHGLRLLPAYLEHIQAGGILVPMGQEVVVGQNIARMGTTGSSTCGSPTARRCGSSNSCSW